MSRMRCRMYAFAVAVLLLTTVAAGGPRSLAAQPGDDRAPGRRRIGPGEGGPTAPAAPVPGGPGYQMLPAVAFHPADQDSEWDFYLWGELANPGINGAFYNAAVPLPHGATVNRLVVWSFDESTTSLTAELHRLHLSQASWDTMAQVQSAGPNYSYSEDTSIDYPVIDLESYAYRVRAYLPGGESDFLGLVAVRIDYEYGAKMPLVLKDQ